MRERSLNMGEDWQRSETGLLLPPRGVPKCLEAGLPIAIELFCGAGGMSCGLHQAGFHVVAAADHWELAAITYLHNLGANPVDLRFVAPEDEAKLEKALRKSWGMKKGDEYPERVEFVSGGGWLQAERDHEVGSCAWHIGHVDEDDPEKTDPNLENVEERRRAFCETYHRPPVHRHGCELFWLGDVSKLTAADFLEPLGLERGEVDLVAGGPPCQGFSHSGKRDVMDPRNSLVFEFTRLVAEINPRSMLMENVPGMVSMKTPEGLPVVEALALDLEGRGYGGREALEKMLRETSGAGAAIRPKPPQKGSQPEEDEEEDAQMGLFANA